MTNPSGITPTIKRARLMEYSSTQEVKMDSAISKVKFAGWINPPKYWEPWVQKLCPDHQSTWKDAGIYEAVMSSTYAIKFHDNLILELVSRWCSQTNTFVFPWGEATLTLQDMLVLGGFSSLGISPLSSLDNDVESLKIEEQLELAAKEIRTSTKTKIARQTKWMEKFIGSGSELEHAAFLSLWLLRFVNPWGSSFGNIINRQVFPIAARLSRGIEIALAPAVLAMLYGELTALKKRLHSTQLGNKERPIELCAPFHLVQIWAWERFPILKPVLDYKCSLEDFPRLARWSNVKISNDKDIKSAIDSSKRAFLCCPYGAFGNLQGRDLESFAQWTETSELIGFDCCIEMYQPKRVTRQFRLDGDVPASSVPFQPTVAACFEKWRRQKRCSKSSHVKLENMVDCDPPPGFPPRIKPLSVCVGNSDSDKDCSVTITEHSKLPVSTTVASCFQKWRKRKICSTSSHDKVENMVDCDLYNEVPSVSNSDSGKDCSVTMIEHPKLPVSKTVSTRAFPSSVALSDSDVVIEVKDMLVMNKIEEPERASIQQSFPLPSAQIKEEAGKNSVPPLGFPPHIEVPSVSNSDSDKDCSVTIEHPKLPVSRIVSTRACPSSVALSDSDVVIEVKDTHFMRKIEEPERASIQQTFPLPSAQIKEADKKCVGNSDSDKDCSVTMIENSKTMTRRVFPSSIASSDSDAAVEVKDMCSMHRIEEPERASTEQNFPLPIAQIKEEADENCLPCGFVSGAKRESVDESIEAVDMVNKSIHEKGDVVDAKYNVIEGMTGRSTGSLGAERSFLQIELSTSCSAESQTNERSKDSDLYLEARISRLENIVYAHIKALEAAR